METALAMVRMLAAAVVRFAGSTWPPTFTATSVASSPGMKTTTRIAIIDPAGKCLNIRKQGGLSPRGDSPPCRANIYPPDQ